MAPSSVPRFRSSTIAPMIRRGNAATHAASARGARPMTGRTVVDPRAEELRDLGEGPRDGEREQGADGHDEPRADRVRPADARPDDVEEREARDHPHAGGRDEDDDVALADLQDLAHEARRQRPGD